MKWLDRYLQKVRIKQGTPFVKKGDIVIDVGCGDGAMLASWQGIIARGIGCDPALTSPERGSNYELYPGAFPDAIPGGVKADVITMFAVLEHIPPPEQARLADVCAGMLKTGGRIVATVPSPRVDSILHVLSALHLIDGIAAHEHYGFEAATTPSIFPAPAYRLERWQRFQFGLNNLFVFEKV